MLGTDPVYMFFMFSQQPSFFCTQYHLQVSGCRTDVSGVWTVIKWRKFEKTWFLIFLGRLNKNLKEKKKST